MIPEVFGSMVAEYGWLGESLLANFSVLQDVVVLFKYGCNLW